MRGGTDGGTVGDGVEVGGAVVGGGAIGRLEGAAGVVEEDGVAAGGTWAWTLFNRMHIKEARTKTHNSEAIFVGDGNQKDELVVVIYTNN